MITNMKEIAQLMPFKRVPLIHCITNDITLETLANTVLYLGGKPIMSSDTREFHYLFQTTGEIDFISRKKFKSGRPSICSEK